jgi:hypothetical protein
LHVSILPELEIANDDELCVIFSSLLDNPDTISELEDCGFGFSTAEEFVLLKSGPFKLSLLQATAPNAATATKATPIYFIGFMMISP